MNDYLIRNQLLTNAYREIGEDLQKTRDGEGSSFREELEKLSEGHEINFSKHAIKRLDERNIPLDQNLLDDLSGAVEEARKKGAREVAVIGRQGIFIVNVPNNTVITTMAENDMKNRLVSNIDGAVFM